MNNSALLPSSFSPLSSRQKRLLLLGGIRYLLPVIAEAHKLGVYVITADYLPDNIAHRYSDEYVNVSILDRETVLNVAREKHIDGILSFGVDPGVVTAAYVAEKLGLPFPSLGSVEILQNKDRFRDFLAAHGFNCPFHFSYEADQDPLKDERLRQKVEVEKIPVIVKPVDSAGSKGCSKVDPLHCQPQPLTSTLSQAIAYARSESHSGRIIIEQFLELQGHQTGSDSFSINNELVFCSFDSQYFDPVASNPYTPAAHIWPSDMPSSAQDELRSELQRLIRLLNLGTTIYNIEARVATDGKPYIMEVSPRGGGNRLAEVLRYATGQDLIQANVLASLGLLGKDANSTLQLQLSTTTKNPLSTSTSSLLSSPTYDGYWADFIIHAPHDGVFQSVTLNPTFESAHVREKSIYVENGTRVAAFTGANAAIGTLFLRFDTYAEAEHAVQHPEGWLKVDVT